MVGELELELVTTALQDADLLPEHAPNDREICEVRVRPVNVFTQYDPYPLWPNYLHGRTRENVVKRALTLQEGDIWTPLAAHDAREALLDPLVFAVAVIVPYEMDDRIDENGEPAECVGLLAVTKDLWSLLVTFSPQIYGGYTETFIGVTETNLMGTNTLFSVLARVDPLRWDLATTLRQRSFLGSNLDLYQLARMRFDREAESEIDGFDEMFILELPLRSSEDRWGAMFDLNYENGTERRYNGQDLAYYDTGLLNEPDVPERWQRESLWVSARVTHAFGSKWRTELSPGAFIRSVATEPDPRADISDEARAIFIQDRLPRSERTIGPSLQWQFFQNKHVNLFNYQNYGVTEAISLGLRMNSVLRYSNEVFGGDDNHTELYSTISYTWNWLEEGLFRLEINEQLRQANQWSDWRQKALMRFVTPRMWGGRLVLEAQTERVQQDTSNVLWSLGVQNGVRGYATGTQSGINVDRINLEWRGKPRQFQQTRIGPVLFFDAARITDDQNVWFPSAGVGLRLALPQVWPVLRSLDIGFPLRYDSDTPFSLWPLRPRPVISLRIDQVF